MGVYELIDLAMSAGNRLDVQIGIFITVHLAIFGGIIYVDRPLFISEKIASLVVYTAFAVLNFRMMQNQLNLIFNIYTEIAKFNLEPCCSSNEIISYMKHELQSGKFDFRNHILIGSHALMYVLVLLSILFDKRLNIRALKESK